MNRKLPIKVWSHDVKLSKKLIKERYERPKFVRVVDCVFLDLYHCIIWVESYVEDDELFLLDLVSYDDDDKNEVYFRLGF